MRTNEGHRGPKFRLEIPSASGPIHGFYVIGFGPIRIEKVGKMTKSDNLKRFQPFSKIHQKFSFAPIQAIFFLKVQLTGLS